MLETNNQTNKLQELRTILNGSEQEEISHLKEKIKSLELELDSRERVKRALEAELEDALVSSENNFRKTVDHLVPNALKSTIKRSPETIVDTLYPVIGDIVGKYVTESLKNFMDSINEKIENQLPYNRIIRSVKAKVRGVSEEELMVMEAQKANVYGVLLIEKGSGIIIDSYIESEFKKLNVDLFAGLLMALQSFGKDCINDDAQGSLDQIEFGENKVLIEAAGSVLIATLVKGSVSKNMLKSVRFVLSGVITTHKSYLDKFSGDSSDLPGSLKSSLNGLISESSYSEKSDSSNRQLYSWLCVGSLVLIGLFCFHTFSVRKDYLAKLDRHLVYKELRLDFKTRFFTTMSLEGSVGSAAQKKELQTYLDSDNIIYTNLEINPEDKTLIENKIIEFERWFSSLRGVSLKVLANEELVFSGSVDSLQKKKFIINKINSMFLDLAPKVSIAVDPDLFYLTISFPNGVTTLTPADKTKIEMFLSAELSGEKFFKISNFSNSLGSQKTKLRFSSLRGQRIKEVLSNLGISDSQIKSEFSLNFEGTMLNERVLERLVSSQKSFVIIEKSLSLF